MVTIVGIEYRKYTSKKTGKKVEGYNIHVTDDEERNGLEGVTCYSEWVSPSLFAEMGIVVGDQGYFSHNRYGTVDSFRPAL